SIARGPPRGTSRGSSTSGERSASRTAVPPQTVSSGWFSRLLILRPYADRPAQKSKACRALSSKPASAMLCAAGAQVRDRAGAVHNDETNDTRAIHTRPVLQDQ